MTICKGLNVAFSFALLLSSFHLISIPSEDKGGNQKFLTTGESQEPCWYGLQNTCPKYLPSAGLEGWAQEELFEFCLFTYLLSWVILSSWYLKARTSYYFYQCLRDFKISKGKWPLPPSLISLPAHPPASPQCRGLSLSHSFQGFLTLTSGYLTPMFWLISPRQSFPCSNTQW